jgi:putative ABC transport system substrate-binding protein
MGIIHSGSPGNHFHDKQIRAFVNSLDLAGHSVAKGNINAPDLVPLWGDNNAATMRGHARNLIHTRGVQVLLAAGGTSCAEQVKSEVSGTAVQVVFTSVDDSFVPGPNMAGICAHTSNLDPTRLSLLNTLGLGANIGVLANTSRSNWAPLLAILTTTAGALRVRLDPQDPQIAPATIANTFQRWATPGTKANAVLVTADPFFNNHRKEIVDAAADQSIPAIYQWREFVVLGGLMSYGPRLTDAYKLAGTYVAKILSGSATAATLPVAPLDTFELVINLGTASALGITIPNTLLSSADEVIE